MLRGRIAIDFRDGPVELGEGDFIVVPRGVEHRPRSLTDEPVVLMFEPATTLNTGNAKSDLTVADLEAALTMTAQPSSINGFRKGPPCPFSSTRTPRCWCRA